jgi:thiamine biosynthesis lipoprotein
MTAPSPTAIRVGRFTPPGPAMTISFRAMASNVTMQVVDPEPTAAQALDDARAVFARVEAACTRFDPGSPLMLANAAAQDWHSVPPECYRALREAAEAHRRTEGLFDPRVLDALVELGYDRTLPFSDGPVKLSSGTDPGAVPRPAARELSTPAAAPAASAVVARREPWAPHFDEECSAVRIGPHAVDLGGIGKGLAVRWAAEALSGAGRAHLIEAGGDCHLGGEGPELAGWRVAVEDPAGRPDPVAVLRLADTGCATSSLRVRSWQRDGRPVHHLIDPRTGTSAAGGLSAVTVADPDPASAEVWSKSLLVAGREWVAALAHRHSVAAFWIAETGEPGWSTAMEPALLWVASGVH